MPLVDDVLAKWGTHVQRAIARSAATRCEIGMFLARDGSASDLIQGTSSEIAWGERRGARKSGHVAFLHTHPKDYRETVEAMRAWWNYDGPDPPRSIVQLADAFSPGDLHLAGESGHDFECLVNLATGNLICVPKLGPSPEAAIIHKAMRGPPTEDQIVRALWRLHLWQQRVGASVRRVCEPRP